jgi:hypothetical protein
MGAGGSSIGVGSSGSGNTGGSPGGTGGSDSFRERMLNDGATAMGASLPERYGLQGPIGGWSTRMHD